MTILKGHGAVPGSKSPHCPTLPGPSRAKPCRAIALLLPTPLASTPKGPGAALASLWGFGAGAGRRLQAGRRQAIGTRCRGGTLRSLLFVFLSFWAFCFKGSALGMFSFTCICRCNRLPSDAPFFFYLGKSSACCARRMYEAQQLPAHNGVCNLSLDKARGPGACRPIQDSRSQRSEQRLGAVCWRGSLAGPRPESAAPSQPSAAGQTCRAGSALLFLCSAQQPRGDSAADTLEKALDCVSRCNVGR